MEVETIVVRWWIEPGESKAMSADPCRLRRKKVSQFITKCRAQKYVSLGQLISFSAKSYSPSLCLTDETSRKLLELLTPRCRQPTIEAMSKVLSRSLSLFPHFLWADDILFGNGGEIAHTARVSTLSQIRKDMLES